MDTFPPAVQRPAMLSLASALSSASTALRRDECGDWRIRGTAGHAYAIPGGFLLIAETGTARAWSAVKRRLAFARVQRDGDDEGALMLDRLPTTAEAREIRRALGIRKRPALMAPPTAPSDLDITAELPIAA